MRQTMGLVVHPLGDQPGEAEAVNARENRQVFWLLRDDNQADAVRDGFHPRRPLHHPVQLDCVRHAHRAMACSVRPCARVVGKTAVGCAVLADEGRTYTGCNVEHQFRCHDVHAE
jgi:hypothetical protein